MRLSFLAVLTGLAGLLAYMVFVRHWDGTRAALTLGGVGMVAAALLIGILLLIAPARKRPALRKVVVATMQNDLRALREALRFGRTPSK
jgi:peptidoglycan/LPS O-acetylase OafA/YrhL